MLSIPLVYMNRRAGAHRTYAHASNLRETPTRHVYPLPFEGMRHYGVLSRCEDCRKVGDVSFTWAEGFCMCFLHTQHDKLGRSRSQTMHCILLVLYYKNREDVVDESDGVASAVQATLQYA